MEENLGLRVPAELLERVDVELEALRRQHPGLRVTRSDMIRQLLTEALDRRQTGAEPGSTAAAA